VSSKTANVELLAALARVLRKRRLRWYLFGAEAVVIWGRPRMTADVDVTVEIADAKLPSLVAALKRAGFDGRVDDLLPFAVRTRVLPLVHHKTSLPLDLVLSGPGLEEEFHARARTVKLGNLRVPVISPEDLVVAKLLAQRPNDIEDVHGIVRRQGDELRLAVIRKTLRAIEKALDRDDLIALFERIRRGRPIK
jgi:hypothetical protein